MNINKCMNKNKWMNKNSMNYNYFVECNLYNDVFLRICSRRRHRLDHDLLNYWYVYTRDSV